MKITVFNEILALHLEAFLRLCLLLQGFRFTLLLTNRKPARLKGTRRVVLHVEFLHTQVWGKQHPHPVPRSAVWEGGLSELHVASALTSEDRDLCFLCAIL